MEEREKDREKVEENGVSNINVRRDVIEALQRFLSILHKDSGEGEVRTCMKTCETITSDNALLENKTVTVEDQIGNALLENKTVMVDDQIGKGNAREREVKGTLQRADHFQDSSQANESKKQTFFKLLQRAASQGESILNDESFVHYCFKAMKFEEDENNKHGDGVDSHQTRLLVYGDEEILREEHAKRVESGRRGKEKKMNSFHPVDNKAKNSYYPVDNTPTNSSYTVDNKPTDKDQFVDNNEATVGYKHEASDFSENLDKGTVHSVPSPGKVHPPVSFAEIAKNNLSPPVNSIFLH